MTANTNGTNCDERNKNNQKCVFCWKQTKEETILAQTKQRKFSAPRNYIISWRKKASPTFVKKINKKWLRKSEKLAREKERDLEKVCWRDLIWSVFPFWVRWQLGRRHLNDLTDNWWCHQCWLVFKTISQLLECMTKSILLLHMYCWRVCSCLRYRLLPFVGWRKVTYPIVEGFKSASKKSINFAANDNKACAK